jgi:hypothetical protein
MRLGKCISLVDIMSEDCSDMSEDVLAKCGWAVTSADYKRHSTE